MTEKIIYKVDDVPPLHLCILFGLQQAIMCIGGTLTIPFILTPLLCTVEEERDEVRAKLLSITMFMCGVATVLQTMFGVRLPVIQGGSHTFVPPIVAMMTLEQFRCKTEGNELGKESTGSWMFRMREIQGNLMLASITQVIIGNTGLIGLIMRFIGPLTISPTIALIGLSLIEVVSNFFQYQWGISIMTTGLVLLFSVYINKIKVPVPTFSVEKKCHVTRLPLFQLFPIVLAVGLAWILCFVLTEAEVFSSNSTDLSYYARTDARQNVIKDAKWFIFPSPLPFGTPTVSAAGYVGMLAATLSSVIESVGDYFAAARLSEASLPPSHALNRGIAIEGFSSIISGLVGAGHATTSYSGNIGIIGITKVASRVVFCTAGFILIICGIIGKFGAFLAGIPDPVIGGTLLIGLGMVISVGISVLQFCDMSSTRNLTILGTSYLAGLMIPKWLAEHPNAINTGSPEFDQTINVLFGTASFTGGIIGFLLDNTVPGTIDERGIVRWRQTEDEDENNQTAEDLQLYEFPYITGFLRRIRCCHYVPISPVYDKEPKCSCCCKNNNSSVYVFEQNVDVELENRKDNSC